MPLLKGALAALAALIVLMSWPPAEAAPLPARSSDAAAGAGLVRVHDGDRKWRRHRDGYHGYRYYGYRGGGYWDHHRGQRHWYGYGDYRRGHYHRRGCRIGPHGVGCRF